MQTGYLASEDHNTILSLISACQKQSSMVYASLKNKTELNKTTTTTKKIPTRCSCSLGKIKYRELHLVTETSIQHIEGLGCLGLLVTHHSYLIFFFF